MNHKRTQKIYNKFHNTKMTKVSIYRAEARYHFLKKVLEKEKGTGLVIGCGSQHEMSVISPSCKGVGVDISDVAIQKSRKRYPRFKYVVADAQKLPFEDNSFDFIVCSEVIEHLPDDESFLEKASKILKPKGRLLLTTPNWINWYGFARILGELILKKPLTSSDQPIDHWYTFWSLKKKTDKYFCLKKHWGLWFYPPQGKGRIMIPDSIVLPVVKLFDPFNIALRSIIPKYGHCLAFDLRNNK